MPDANRIHMRMNECLADMASEKNVAGPQSTEGVRQTARVESAVRRLTDGDREPIKEALFNGGRPEAPIIA